MCPRSDAGNLLYQMRSDDKSIKRQTMAGILIKGGTVIDGSGAPGRNADVLVEDEKIKEIGDISEDRVRQADPEARVIEAGGKVVCPGFIDIHAHSDFSAPVNGAMEEKIRQGVTTVVMGSCGFSGAPSSPRYVNYLNRYTGGMFGTECPFQWESMQEYLEYLVEKGIAANVVPQVGFGNLRVMTRGLVPGAPSEAQIGQMKSALSKALDEGARGFTTGLFYPPQSMATPEEVKELVGALAGRDAVYATHVRNEVDELESAVREAIDTARGAGVSLQVSHHKAILQRNWGKVHGTIEIMEKARAEGLDIDTDVYPYTAFSNIIMPFFLKYEPGMEENILFLYMKHYKECEGKTLGEVMRMKRMGIKRLILTMALKEGFSGMPIAGFMVGEDDLNFLLAHPMVSIGSDGVESFGKKAHPRLWGTFPRMIEKYCRDDKLVTLEDAVRKMTSLAARKYNLKMRGELKERYYADIVVFDPENLRENTTYRDPLHFPTGFEAVIVNGKIAAYKDVQTGERAGRPV